MRTVKTKRAGKVWSVVCTDCGSLTEFVNPDRGMIEIWCREIATKHEQDHLKNRI